MQNIFFIITLPRSGTHLLESSLNNHSQIKCLWEPLNEELTSCDFTGREFLDGLNEPENLIGIPMHWNHARNHYVDIWDIIKYGKYPVIHLNRRDLIERFVSEKISNNTHVWQVYESKKLFKGQVFIDLNELEVWIADQRKIAVEMDDWFRTLDNFLTVSYFSIVKTNGLQTVQRYLGVKKQRIKSKIIKMGKPLIETVENFEELKQFVKKNKIERFSFYET